jgi:hypothetical protein
MKHFKASGLWFKSDDQGKRVAGTLRYSSDGLHLELIGSLTEGWRPGALEYDKIFGVVGDCPCGSFVTLFDSFTKSSNINNVGIGSETIYCNTAIIGSDHIKGELAPSMESIDLTLSYLSDWAGATRYELDTPSAAGEGRLSIHFNRPETLLIRTEEESFNIGFSVKTSHHSHGASIRDEAHIIIRPAARLTHQEMIDRYMRSVQNLLTFATDTPNAVDNVVLSSVRTGQSPSDWGNKFHFVFMPILEIKKKRDALGPRDMLFSLAESQQAGLNIFQRWFEFTTKHEAFCTVYFATLYAQPRYLDEKFLRLMSAFPLLCRSLAGVSSRAKQAVFALNAVLAKLFTEGERKLLGHVIAVESEVEMPFHLMDLLNEHGDLMNQIIGEDCPAFVRSITDSLSYVERRVTSGDSQTLQGVDMINAMHKIQVLIKIIVLKELGFDQAKVAKVIERSRHFKHLKTLVNTN